MQASANHGRPARSGCRRAAGCFGWLLLFVLVILFIPPQLSRLRAGDLKPPAVPDVADDQNAWIALRAVADKLTGEAPNNLAKAMPSGHPTADARAWIEQNAALLPELDAALALPQAVYRTSMGVVGVGTMGDFDAVTSFACLASATDAEAGRLDRATQRLHNLLRFFHEVLTGDAPEFVALLGGMVEAHALEGTRLLTEARPVLPDAQTWQALRNAILAGPSTEQVVRSTMEGEYRKYYQVLLSPDGPPKSAETDSMDLQARRIPANCFYDPWRSAATFRDVMETVVAEAAKPRPQRSPDRLDPDRLLHGGPVYNAIGFGLLQMSMPTIQSIVDIGDRQLALRRLSATMIALRMAFDRDGKLPATLNDLVTTGLLDQVPIDPFDEQPVRYDPQRALLWSINDDEEDDGGVASRGTGMDMEWPDLVVPLAFSR